MKLVDDEGGHVAEQRIVLQIRGQDAFGHDEQLSVGHGLPLEADVPAHLAAEGPTALVGDAARHRPRRHPPRLEKQHSSLVHEGRRHPRRLAGSRRRRQHRRPMAVEGGANGVDVGIDGEHGRGHVTYDGRP